MYEFEIFIANQVVYVLVSDMVFIFDFIDYYFQLNCLIIYFLNYNFFQVQL